MEKQLLLQAIDSKWREHLITLEHLRSVVGFRGYAQRDPLNEYKNEAFQLFETMLDSLRAAVTQHLSRIRPLSEEQQQQMLAQMAAQQKAVQDAATRQKQEARAPTGNGAEPASALASAPALALSGGDVAEDVAFSQDDPSTWGKTGRNQPCPCGSGKKFKHCHGRQV